MAVTAALVQIIHKCAISMLHFSPQLSATGGVGTHAHGHSSSLYIPPQSVVTYRTHNTSYVCWYFATVTYLYRLCAVLWVKVGRVGLLCCCTASAKQIVRLAHCLWGVRSAGTTRKPTELFMWFQWGGDSVIVNTGVKETVNCYGLYLMVFWSLILFNINII